MSDDQLFTPAYAAYNLTIHVYMERPRHAALLRAPSPSSYDLAMEAVGSSIEVAVTHSPPSQDSGRHGQPVIELDVRSK